MATTATRKVTEVQMREYLWAKLVPDGVFITADYADGYADRYGDGYGYGYGYIDGSGCIYDDGFGDGDGCGDGEGGGGIIYA
jgi:hypothetical protein